MLALGLGRLRFYSQAQGFASSFARSVPRFVSKDPQGPFMALEFDVFFGVRNLLKKKAFEFDTFFG